MRTLSLCLLLTLTTLAFGADWPQWHGLHRDGVSAEHGLLTAWPEGGPRLLWTAEGLGDGYSSVAIASGRIYTTGDVNREGFLFCLDCKGTLLWKVSYGTDGTVNAPYARSTPTIDDNNLYLMTAQGTVLCFDANTGERRWVVDTVADFQAQPPSGNYGISESLAIAGNIVICTPGGKKAAVVGLDKQTGKVCWATTDIHEPSGYNQPLVVKRGKRWLAVVMTEMSMLGIDAETGKVYWRVPYPAKGQQCFTPLFADGILYAPVGVNSVAMGFALSTDGTTLTPRWTQPRMTVNMGGVVILNGYVYGTNGNWHALCLDLRNGNIMYESVQKTGLAATIAADGLLLMYNTDGVVSLVKAAPTGYQRISSFTVTQGKNAHWAHPALSDGVLYIRHGDVLLAFAVAH